MGDYIEEIFVATRFINDASLDLRAIAKAFMTTGNTKMSEDLYSIAEDITLSAKQVENAISKNLSRQVKEGREFNANILKMALDAAIEKK